MYCLAEHAAAALDWCQVHTSDAGWMCCETVNEDRHGEAGVIEGAGAATRHPDSFRYGVVDQRSSRRTEESEQTYTSCIPYFEKGIVCEAVRVHGCRLAFACPSLMVISILR